MSVQIRFYGVSAFEFITENEARIFVDPILNENCVSPVKVDELEKVDLVLDTGCKNLPFKQTQEN